MSATCNTWHLRDSARHFVSLAGRRLLVIVGVLPILILALCLACRPEPPDITSCTRIEVRYANGALNYFFQDSAMQKEVLNEKEREYIRSYDTWTVTDQEQIGTFAQQVSQGSYRGWRWSLLALIAERAVPTKIVAYRPRGGRVSFSVYSAHGSSTIRAGGRLFGYDSPDDLSLASLDPPGLEPLRARWECARHMRWLIHLSLSGGPPPVRPHMDPNHWSDTIVENARKNYISAEIGSDEMVRMYPDVYIATAFTCPGIHACPDVFDYRRVREARASSQPVDIWTSDYAMNPNCQEDSPKDMVFLFESKPGWNQHGGPELFTFDNHNPRGGCVLLNDGTVKFIRTEQELHALRWK